MMNARARWSFLVAPLLAAIGCSDPVPLPPKGNLTLSLQVPAGGGSCPVPGRTYEIGAPNAPSTQDPGDRVVDGQKGSAIKCSVHGKGPFTFSGSLRGISSDENRSPVTISFTDGQIAADKSGGTVTVGVNTPDLGGFFQSEPGACKLTIVNQQIKPGSIWTSVSCPLVTQPPANSCTVGMSTVVIFENCDGS